MKYVLYAYIVLIPFLHALSPVPVQSIAFFLIVAVSPFVFLYPIEKTNSFARQDLFLFLVAGWGLLAWMFYKVPTEMDRYQGAAQWISSMIFSLIIVRKLVLVSKVTMEDIGRAASVSMIVLSVAIIADFYLANFDSRYLSDIIPFSVSEFPKATILGIFERPRGLTVEAGFNGIIYECLLPFVIFHFLTNRNILSFISISISSIGFILIFSSAAIFSIVIATSILFLLKRKSFFALAFVLIATPGLLYLSLANPVIYNLFGYKIAEFLDTSNYEVLGVGRQGALFYGFELFWENIFGIGWGTVLQEANIPGTIVDYNLDGGGLISLWLELLVATGVVGFSLFAYIFGKNIKGLADCRNPASGFIFVSLTAVSIHHLFVYDMWFPMIWFSLAVAQVALSEKHGPRFMSRSVT